MNIFYLAKCAKLCAMYHNDKHCVKMILETCQLLYTCLWLCMPNEEWVENAPKTKSGQKGFKKSFVNHPCAKWLRESINNYKWLCDLGFHLCEEYTHRYGKVHSCEKHILWLKQQTPILPDVPMTKIKLAMPDQYKCDDPIEAYRKYYIGHKKRFSTWKKRDIPPWFPKDEEKQEDKKALEN